MNNKVIYFAMFAAGTAIGSFATWQFTKAKYEQIAKEEIESVKEVYARKAEELTRVSDHNAVTESQIAEPDILQGTKNAYFEKIKKEGYVNYSALYDAPDLIESNQSLEELIVDEPIETSDIPYVIPPEDFGERDEYAKISLTYYADDILADEDDRYIDNVNDIVGRESLEHFGEYEDDSVFVRNDKLKCDYEILLDQRKYSDVINKKPYVMED